MPQNNQSILSCSRWAPEFTSATTLLFTSLRRLDLVTVAGPFTLSSSSPLSASSASRFSSATSRKFHSRSCSATDRPLSHNTGRRPLLHRDSPAPHVGSDGFQLSQGGSGPPLPLMEVATFSGVAPANQTKKKSQFMNFSQGHSGTKVQCEHRACFPKEKHQNSHKNGRNS